MTVGVFSPYGGTVAPNGYVMADGATLSRTLYKDLFAIFGERYGAGDGATTFDIPDLRSRIVVGAGQDSGATLKQRDLGVTGGDEATNSIPAVSTFATASTPSSDVSLANASDGFTSQKIYSNDTIDTSISGVK